jgi:hypothetical protein
MVGQTLAQVVFELGKVITKLELSKGNTAEVLQSQGGSEEEILVLQKIGKFWNQQSWLDRPDGLVVVTSRRLVFLAKLHTIATSTDFLSFPLEIVENLRTDRVWWISPAIRFEVQGKPFVFTFFANAEEMSRAIENCQKANQRPPD